ncbi:glycoside hydrolase [Gyrodon lividus]|nr:glycoside hydrolase [Gyrodon lividus]
MLLKHLSKSSSYAAEEINTLGHTTVVGESHPEHVVYFQATPWVDWASEPPAGPTPSRKREHRLLHNSLLSAVAKMFPSKLSSTGSDEIHMSYLRTSLSSFTQITHGALQKLGKTPVIRKEMVLGCDVTLPNNTVVVAQKGFQIVHAASHYFYLDCGGGGWVGNNPLGNNWCDPFKTWQKAESQSILCGQHLLWSEQSSPHSLDLITSRATSSSELFSSGPAANGHNIDTALPRLHDVAYRMTDRGVAAIALEPM